MSAGLARQRYLQRHIEAGLPDSPRPDSPWRNVLVVPAYRESAGLLHQLAGLGSTAGRSLVILVLNRPASDPDPAANAALRQAAGALPACSRFPTSNGWHQLNPSTDLHVHDMDLRSGPLPEKQGVGLARKTGCDIAFKWMSQGAIDGNWICSTDADARLPRDYFSRLGAAAPGAAAAVYPFRHVPGEDRECDRATALYELRLHQYVLGLEYAGSPYAYHTLGSCLAVTFEGYARVHGFPKRAGAEDFYLLNKLAKTGPVARLRGACVELRSRSSQRVPFGTGPAVARINAAGSPAAQSLFYHPACFEALRAILAAVPDLSQAGLAGLPDLVAARGIAGPLRRAVCDTLETMGLADALDHCRRQGRSPDQFLRQFHQWFDAFRTLRFIHGIRDAGWTAQSLAGLRPLQPQLWPGADEDCIEGLRRAIRKHRGWTR